MKINKKKVIPTLALIGLTLGATGVTAAEVAKSSRPIRSEEHARHKGEFRNLFQNLTDEQKEALKKARELHKEGKHEEAMSLITSAGIVLPEIKDPEQHKERKRHFDELIESNDYEAFRQKVADTPMADIIDTQDKFDALVESHELRDEGKYEEAREILEDAGIKPPLRLMKHSNT
jgi:hypothetical protein